MRFPVAAKIALHTAGPTGRVAGSPTPIGFSVLGTMYRRPDSPPLRGAPHAAAVAC
jgi:hypothetical protein